MPATDTDDSQALRKEGPVIVALGFGGSGQELVRAGSALARDWGVELECLTIETGEVATAEEGERLAEAQRLATSLGARVASEPNMDAVAGVLRHARERGALAIVAGAGRRRLLRRGFARGFAARLRARGGDLRIVALAPPRPAGGEARAGGLRPGDRLGAYLLALLVIAAVTVLNVFLAAYAGYWAAAIPYLAAISLSALALGTGPVLFAALISALAWDLLFIPPRFALHISKPEDTLMLALYLLVALLSGLMTGRLRSSERLLAARELRMSRISELASALAGTKALQRILDTGVEALKEAFSVEAIVILKEGDEGLRLQPEGGWEALDESARDAARLSYEQSKGTGRYTKTRPESEWHFVPMEAPRGCLGVIGVRAASDRAWDEGLESFLRTMVATVSIAAARELGD
jgi:two-component system, OmpR family, sensor histidine kinase KdpD